MKVQVIMQSDFVSRLDAQAKKKGLSRSAYINMCMIDIVESAEAREDRYNAFLEDNSSGEKEI